VRRYQRYRRSLKERRHALKPGDLERIAVDFDIRKAEENQPGRGYLRRKRERERDTFMARLARKYGDRGAKLRPRCCSLRPRRRSLR
jgi:hypothetical protein